LNYEPEPQESHPGLPPYAGWLGWLALVALTAAAGYFLYLHQYKPNHLHDLWPDQYKANQPGLLSTFRHVVDLHHNPYHYFGNIDSSGLLIALLAAVVLIVVGHAALTALNLRLPRLVHLALAYVLGMGIIGVLLEVETIFRLHSRWSIVATILAALAALAIAAQRRMRALEAREGVAQWTPRPGELAREIAHRFRQTLRSPGPLEMAAGCVLLVLIGAITLLTFYHGALTPVTYWDSLILYVGYARKIYLEHAFPFKAVAQVGIGLGANYPHLYALLTASTATAAGWWSDSFAQVGPPLAGLLSCFLVYALALRLTRDRLLALALTALFRAVPYGIAYFTYASDYAYILLFTAAFLYAVLLYFETNLIGYFVLATLIAAFAMHINYLMGLLWVIWAAMVLLAHARPVREFEETPLEVLEDEDMPYDAVERQMMNPRPPRLGRVLRSSWFWTWLLIGIAVASPWYIRNWALTGNPVYAFFANLFPKTIHYNQEVMDSAVVEWTMNGDGIGRASLTREFWRDYETFRRSPDVTHIPVARIDTPLSRKLARSWVYWVTDFHAWKLAPTFIGLAVPGVLIFLVGSRLPRRLNLTDRPRVARRRFGWICALLLLFLLAYHYLLADFYLYQILPVVVLIPIFGAYAVRMFAGPIERAQRVLFVALAIWISLFPGLAQSLMGFKIKGEVRIGGRLYSPFELVALHNIGLDKTTFLRFVYGDDVDAWAALNTYALDEKVLTHENRHLVLDPRVGIVHFDDWETQQIWRKPPAEQLRGLQKLGVRYYFFMPNETQHQVNRRIGPPGREFIEDPEPEAWRLSALRGWMGTDVLELIDVYGPNRLYRFRFPDEKPLLRP
jgi:hypothetical protein